MNAERFLEELPESQTPGLAAFDPRLSDIMAAVQNGNMDGAVELSLDLFDSGEYDLRVIGYVLYADFATQGANGLPTIFDAFAAIFGRNWPAFGPEKNKEKHGSATVAWFIKTLGKQFERMEETVGSGSSTLFTRCNWRMPVG